MNDTPIKIYKRNQAPSVSIKIKSIDLLPLPHLSQLANLTAANVIKCIQRVAM